MAALIEAALSRAPSTDGRLAAGPVSYDGPGGQLHGFVDATSTVIHGHDGEFGALGEIAVPWGASGDAPALAAALADELAIRVGSTTVRAYRRRTGRGRASRAVTLQGGGRVLLWRARGRPGGAAPVLERADGAVLARLSADGRLRVDAEADPFELALAAATALSGLAGSVGSVLRPGAR